MKVAIVTGATGQDGAFLSKLLLDREYKVIGIQRRTSTSRNLWRLQDMGILNHANFELVYGDICDQGCLCRIFKMYSPDEIYNLAAQSFVAASWNMPNLTMDVTGSGAVNVFEAAKLICPEAKIYQASSSEMFGGANMGVLLDEQSRFDPKSPYAAAKVLAHNMADVYRKSYGMYIACGVLFNHESPYRGIEFVTRKITDGVAQIYLGQADHIELGNINAMRDWGYAGDYVEAMHQMLQKTIPEDFVIATGKSLTIKEFCQAAFSACSLDSWEKYIKINKQFYRPNEVHCLTGNNYLAKTKLGWVPKTSFSEMVDKMVEVDIKRRDK